MAASPKRPKSQSKPKVSSTKQQSVGKSKGGKTEKPGTSKSKKSLSSGPKPKIAAPKAKTKAAAPKRRASGAHRALVVGISAYPEPIDPLPAVAADVRDMAKILKSKDGAFRTTGVTSLIEKAATRSKILDSLRETLAEASPEETVFVYLAGHGGIDKDQYYYIAHDTDCDRMAETGVSLTRIKTLFDASKSQRAFLWLDFCHSGGILVRGRRAPMPNDQFLIKRAIDAVKGRGKVIVAACTPNQSAWENEQVGHGLFTDALLRGLKGGAKVEGEVTANSLFDYIDRQIGSDRQRPVQSGEMTGRIVLMHYQDRSSVVVKPKITTPKNSKIKKVPSTSKSTAKPKGTWVMLGNHFFLAQTIHANRDGLTTLSIASTDGDQEANLVGLRPGPYGGGSTIPFAWKNEAGSARVKDVESVTDGKRHVWTINLTPQDKTVVGALYEPSYNLGGQSLSADDIAELRAKRILLNDPPEKSDRDRSHGADGFIESYIRGTNGRSEVRTSPIPGIYAEHRGDRNWKHYARLRAVHLLKTSGTVNHILELEFGAIRSGGVAVKFRGRRDRAGSDKTTVIKFEGVCPLN